MALKTTAMQQVEMNILIDKQLSDLLIKAGNIVSGTNSEHAIEEFSLHSQAVKKFLQDHVTHTGIRKFAGQIPAIDFKKSSLPERVAMTFPFFSGLRRRKNERMKNAINDIKEAQGVYATIYYLHEADIN
jgi:hypothetical protein